MTILYLSLFSFIGLILLVVHSYFKRGFRLTLSFFLFSFVVGMRKEAGTFLGPSLSNMRHPTPFIHTTNYPLLFSVLNTTIGWMLAFYLSWCIAEKIIERSTYLKGKIFPTLLFAGMVIAALSYAIEATAINIGWWKWVFFDVHLAGYLVGGVHLFALSAWFYFAVHFLAPYFLIECSPFRQASWKCIFFLIPFSRTCTMLFLGSDLPRMVHEFIIFFILMILVLVNPLHFNYPNFKERLTDRSLVCRLVDIIPYIVASIILTMLIFIDIIKIKNPYLLISLFPLVVLILLSLQKVPVRLIAFLALGIGLAFGKFGIAVCIPVLIFLGLNAFFNLRHATKI